MPITWTVSPALALVSVAARGIVESHEMETCLDAIVASDVVSYRKIFDVSFATLSLGREDIKKVGKRIADHAKTGPVGPIAIIVGSDPDFDLAEIFVEQASAVRIVRIFEKADRARAWLDEVAPQVREQNL
jgi:hypothetical protein